jgi:hypothetical protein
MGSPLSPGNAKLFMEHFEDTAQEGAKHKPVCWFRYVDDTFVIWPRGPGKLSEFLGHLNIIHENIQFTMRPRGMATFPSLIWTSTVT